MRVLPEMRPALAEGAPPQCRLGSRPAGSHLHQPRWRARAQLLNGRTNAHGNML